MKKYVLGIFAFMLVIVLSAYKSNTLNKEFQSKSEKTELSLYWYPVQGSGNIDHTQLINSTKMTKTQLRNASLIPCDELPGTDCIRGFTDEQPSDVFTPGDDVVQKQN